jgi:hypothetical protein
MARRRRKSYRYRKRPVKKSTRNIAKRKRLGLNSIYEWRKKRWINQKIHDTLRNKFAVKMLRRKRAAEKRKKQIANQRAFGRSKKVSKYQPVSPIEQAKQRRICANRTLRREVLFALRKTGKKGQKKPIRRHPGIICRKN